MAHREIHVGNRGSYRRGVDYRRYRCGGLWMIFIDKNPNGSLTVSAEVRDEHSATPWFTHHTFYGYTKTEAKKQFIQHLKDHGFTLIK